MVVKTFYRTRKDGVNLYKIESDAEFYILQNETNRKYSIVIDVENSGYTYTEMDEKIKKEEDRLNDSSVLREQENISSTSNNT